MSILVYVAVFAAGTAVMVGIMLGLGVRPLLRGWDLIHTFILAFILHLAVIGIDFMLRGPAVTGRI